MKKSVSILLATALAATLLAGCGHTHVWQEATCTAPKTCTECQEIEGEALPHTWAEATCAAPKTCTVCGTTEGETLSHTLTPANYQSAAICTVCGTTEGEPLPAIFAEKGYPLMTEGVEYEYHSICSSNHSLPTVGTVSVDNYRIVASDDTHQARDGYEWRIANVNFTFSDENARKYGYRHATRPIDYYSAPSFAEGTPDFNFNGVDYECETEFSTLQNGWTGDIATVVLETAIQVPIGYDGIVLCMYNLDGRAEDGAVKDLSDLETTNPLFFRMA